MSQIKYVLEENEMPKYFYNIVADLPTPPPAVLHPGTKQPVGPLAKVGEMSMFMKNVSLAGATYFICCAGEMCAMCKM